MTVALAGGEPQPLLVDENSIDWNPIWSPDGRHVYFSSNRGGSMNLWRIAIDQESGAAEADAQPITTPAPFAAHLSISAEGRQLAYSSIQETQNIQGLAFDPVKAEPVGLPKDLTTGSRKWSSPDPSPDGTSIVFYSQVQPEGDLYIIRSDGTGLRQLTGDAATDRVPRWSPDGKSIAVFSDRNGRLQTWIINADGSELRQATDGVEHGTLTWSPDAQRIAVSVSLAESQGSYAVAEIVDVGRPYKDQTVRIITSGPTPLPGFVTNSWSLDGKWIAGQNGYVVEGISIYSVEHDTYTRVSEVGAWPVWFPDSRRVLVVSRGREFHVIDSQTKTSRMVFSVPRDTLGPPRLTRDGTMAYFSRRVTEADVWLVNLR